jgi:hypothetical protein
MARLVAAALLGLTAISPAEAQHADALETLRKTMGETMPGSLRITAAGSVYIADGGGSEARQHARLQTFTQEIDLTVSRLSERYVIVDTRPAAPEPTRSGSRVVAADAAWADQYALWTTPYGFLAGASSRPHRVSRERVLGRAYEVITFSAASGREVRGFVNENSLIERVRTTFEGADGALVEYEAVYLDWADRGAVQYPGVIIQKENGQVARILVVDAVTADGPARTTTP